MGKKVDLNKPRTNNGNIKKSNHNFYHPSSNNSSNSNDDTSANSTNSPSTLQKKGAEVAMRAAGVPKGIANSLANDERTYELAEKANITIKMPLPVKIAINVLLYGIPLIGLMLFVVLFGNEASASSYGSFAYGNTCTTITVTDTGCNGNAENCTYKYDGSVDLEDYVAGVVAAEIGSANNLEYYKATATIARTFVLGHIGDDCTVKGNASFQAYMDVEDSGNAELIKQAVEETEGLVIVKDGELVGGHYASACVVNADEDYYYVRYGTISLGEANFQKIPKEWDVDGSVFNGYLSYWYSLVDQTNTDYKSRKCPNNHDYGMTQIGALYLATMEDYDYEDIIKYYYGEDSEIMKNEMQLAGVDDFINPTRYIHCSSAFGYRTHPVRQEKQFHSGLDIGISGGEPVYAAKTGKVIAATTNITAINNCNYGASNGYGYGNHIIIDHGDGTSTVYAHLKYGSIPSSITVGTEVEQGEQIAQVGSTGCSTGNHLHYEVRVNNERVDPADYLDLTEATGTCRR